MPFEKQFTTTTTPPPPATKSVMIGTGVPYLDPVAANADAESIWIDRNGPFGLEVWQKRLSSGWNADLSPQVFDVRRFGAIAGYVNNSNRGLDNVLAFRAAVAAAQAAGGGFVYIPSGRYWMSGSVEITNWAVHVVGAGSRATYIYFEPESPLPAFVYDLPASPTPTLGHCSLRELSLRGIVEVGDSRHRKVAVHIIDTSEMLIENVDCNDWQTGLLRVSEGPSIGLRSAGKEFTRVMRCTFVADRPISIEKNPKQTSPQIDCDVMHIQDAYLIVRSPAEAAIFIDEGLVIRNFVMDGSNIFAGGKYGIYWNDPIGSQDATSFKVSGLRHEQAAQSGGYTIYISRTGGGKLFNLHLEQISPEFNFCGGIYLNGTINSRIINCAYYRATNQAASPKALVLNANCFLTVVDQFFIPQLVAGNVPLADVASQQTIFSTGYFADSRSQLPAYVVYDSTTTATSATTSATRFVVGADPGAGGSVGATLRLHNLVTAPTSNPTAGGIIFVDGGVLKYKGPGGTVTTIAPA